MSDAVASPNQERPSTGIGRFLPLLILAVSMAIPWFSAGDHPLYPPDEGRYGTVSMHMAEGGSWLVPRFRGEAHLSKPPLAYSCQAAALRAFGHTELAVRFPSLIACSLTILLLYLTARQIGGESTAALAAGTLAMMPLFVLVGRLGTTDAMLTLFCFTALTCGYFAIEAGRGRYAIILWSAIALSWLTKGPLALMPIGILLLWLAFARRWRDARHLHIALGLPLSLLPILTWVWLVVQTNPEAIEVWRNEIIHRITGGAGAHPEPVWYYIPVFLAGLFPATAMLALPGWNLSWRAAWRKLRAGGGSCLWSLAVIGPLIVFSLMSGKLATYVLPLCPPLALLNGLMLQRWLSGLATTSGGRRRPPEVVGTLGVFVILTVAGIIAGAALLGGHLLRWTPALLPLPVACLWLWFMWRRRPQRRGPGLAAVWAAWMIAWVAIFVMEDDALAPHDAAALVQRARVQTGDKQPSIYTFGFSDPTLSFYNRKEAQRIHYGIELESIIAEHDRGEALVLLVDDNSLGQYRQRGGGAIDAFARVGTWQRTIIDTTGIYLPVRGATRTAAPGIAAPGISAHGIPAPGVLGAGAEQGQVREGDRLTGGDLSPGAAPDVLTE